MECLLDLVNSTAASGWWCSFECAGGSAVDCSPLSSGSQDSEMSHNTMGTHRQEVPRYYATGVKGRRARHDIESVWCWESGPDQ